MISICYVCPADPSGYGEANRMDIASLYIAGINVTVESLKQMSEDTSYGLAGDIVNQVKNRKIPYRIKISHTTPDLLPRYQEDGIYHIQRLFWETDRLPTAWIKPLNNIQEIWTASIEQAEMIKKSGVATPIYCFPQAIDVSHAYEAIPSFQTEYPKDFIFYSIAQWIIRKNHKTLLRAYWKEFAGNPNVTLLIKTYGVGYMDNEFERIKSEIEVWRKELGNKTFPKIFFVDKLLTSNQILKLHQLGDCFVDPSSGEGWNRCTQEAMLLGKPVITGATGGITDIMSKDCYYKVETAENIVRETPSIPWYTSNMKWWEIDEASLRNQMRTVYEYQHPALEVGSKAKQFIVDNFSYQRVGDMMKRRLEEIYETL